jgi:DNA-binding LacI/PurR family transcriptional regulator
MLREDFVDAIIFFGADLRPDIAKQIVKSHIPCLKIDSWKRLPGHSLNYDEAQGINLALTEFNRLGRSHPAFLYAFEDKYSQSRRKAFLELSSKMGFKDAVTAKHGDKDLPSVFSNILKKIPKTDSVILQHPILIGNFDLALKSLGKKTPEDISLACFHYNHYVLLSYPKIFYLNTNPPSLAKKIFELLEKQMNNKYLPPLTTWPYTTRI